MTASKQQEQYEMLATNQSLLLSDSDFLVVTEIAIIIRHSLQLFVTSLSAGHIRLFVWKTAASALYLFSVSERQIGI